MIIAEGSGSRELGLLLLDGGECGFRVWCGVEGRDLANEYLVGLETLVVEPFCRFRLEDECQRRGAGPVRGGCSRAHRGIWVRTDWVVTCTGCSKGEYSRCSV